MKKMKKVFAFTLALVMVMSLTLSLTASADTHGTVIIEPPPGGRLTLAANDFTAYRIFNLLHSADERFIYEILPAFDTDAFVPPAEAAALWTAMRAGQYVGSTNDDSPEMYALTGALFNFIDTLPVDVRAAISYSADLPQVGPNVSFTLPQGYYLISGGGTALNPDLNDAISDVEAVHILTTVVPGANPNIIIKADAPTIDKKVSETGAANTWEDYINLNIGDTAYFQITSAVPNMRGYTTYNFTVFDRLSGGLTFNPASLAITIGDVPVPSTAYTIDYSTDGSIWGAFPSPYPATGLYIRINFADFIQYRNRTNQPIVITYSATLNENAVVTTADEGAAGNPNEVWLVYSNDPYSDATGRTPWRRVRVFTFDVPIVKTDVAGTPLAGAIFQLYRLDEGATFGWDPVTNIATGGTVVNLRMIDAHTYAHSLAPAAAWPPNNEPTPGTTYDRFITTDIGNGIISIQGLAPGTYFFVETEAPAGYNKLTVYERVDIVYSTINYRGAADPLANLFDFTAQRTINGYVATEIGIQNRAGVLFPGVGGIGRVIFLVLGLSLMGGAVVMMVKRRSVKRAKK